MGEYIAGEKKKLLIQEIQNCIGINKMIGDLINRDDEVRRYLIENCEGFSKSIAESRKQIDVNNFLIDCMKKQLSKDFYYDFDSKKSLVYKDTITFSNGRTTKLFFSLDAEGGIMKDAMECIVKVFKEYMEKYPQIEIYKLGDSLGFQMSNVFFVKTKNISALYNNEDMSIIFNTELLKDLKIDGTPVEISERVMPTQTPEQNVRYVTTLNDLIFVTIHEFAHAISYQYGMEEISELKDIYEKSTYITNEKYQKSYFKNIHEFIAECYVASEVSNEKELSPNVRKIMDKRVAEGSEFPEKTGKLLHLTMKTLIS